MNLSSLYDQFPILGIVAGPPQSESASVLLGNGTGDGGASASATASVRVVGGSAETTAALSVVGSDGKETNSTTTVRTTGDETTTAIDMNVQQSDENVTTQTDASAEAKGGDDAEVTVTAEAETTVDDELVVLSAGQAGASGDEPMASVDMTNSIDQQEDSDDDVYGNVKTEASVLFEDDADAEAETTILVGPDLNISFEDADDTVTLDDGRLVAQSFEIVEASGDLADEDGLLESITFAGWLSSNDLW